MVSVNISEYRRYVNGKAVDVSSHKRDMKTERGNYDVPYLRQVKMEKVNKQVDALIKAKKPGMRFSESGKIYYERRENRSDENDYL